jgi:hypothetical protein
MKKWLLSCFVLGFAAGVHAQSLQLSSYIISVTGDKDSLLHSTAVLHNVGSASIDVRVDKIDGNIASGQYSYYCWAGQCYSPATITSPFTTTLAPGDSSTTGAAGFIAYLAANSYIGNSDVTYCFYDDANIADSACITFNYSAIATGIRELVASGITLTNPQPNPASSSTLIGFNTGNVKNPRLVMYNMLGSVVREFRLTDKQKLLVLSTADLKNGVYMYSLIGNDKTITSRRLIVNHN